MSVFWIICKEWARRQGAWSQDETERLAEHYEQLGDEDILVEWERAAVVTIFMFVGDRGRLMWCSPKTASVALG